MTFNEWFQSKQGEPYDSMYLFARDAWAAAREAACAEIKAADDKASDNDYMLDSNDCIAVIRGTWQAE